MITRSIAGRSEKIQRKDTMSRQYIFFISQIKLCNGCAKKQKSCLKSQNTGKKNSFYPHKNADKKNTDC